MKKRRLKLTAIICGALVLLGIGFLAVNHLYFSSSLPPGVDTAGMLPGFDVECYQNTTLLKDYRGADLTYDVKYVLKDLWKARLVDCGNGYKIDLPKGTQFSFAHSEFGVEAVYSGKKVVISREYSMEPDLLGYIDHYYNRFMLSEAYRNSNNIELHEDGIRRIGDYDMRIISLTRTPYEGSDVALNSYTYAYILDPQKSTQFLRVMIKSEAYHPAEIDEILSSVRVMSRIGMPTYVIDTEPVYPAWNEETAGLYKQMQERTDLLWGVYTHQKYNTEGLDPDIAKLEQKLDYHFPLVLRYTYLYNDPPLQGMEEAYQDGKLTELTLQICTIDNAGLDSALNPMFEALDGQKDDIIRSFARGIKKFGHPVLFRLNNEMNTDWTSYSGVVTLCDPDIYKGVFNRVFDIFKQEGVDNVIWIFNPQYGNYPPASWNHYMNYYPGSDKVQMLGVTAYNTGNYYKKETSEDWHSFDALYSDSEKLYMRDFSHLPWIITEFASSSYGGNKANWIRNMFADIKKFKNIKAAVWFSHADYDPREGREGIIARPYFLDETEETAKAFADGLHGIVPEERLPE